MKAHKFEVIIKTERCAAKTLPLNTHTHSESGCVKQRGVCVSISVEVVCHKDPLLCDGEVSV